MGKERDESELDVGVCDRLLRRVRGIADPAWRELAATLWPELLRQVRKSRTMAGLGRGADHTREAALLVLEKLGRDDCRAARLYAPWKDAHPDRDAGDWLRIVTANVVRDYVRERHGRAAAGPGEARPDRRLIDTLATLLPDDEELAANSTLSSTSRYAAHELAGWADGRLPPDQASALGAWLRGASFEEMATALGATDAAAAKRLVRAAIASLRRHAEEAS